MSQYNDGIKAFVAGEDLAAFVCVKLDSSNQVIMADAGEDPIGVTTYAVSSGEYVSVARFTSGGTLKIKAGAAISAGAYVYPADDGVIAATPIGNPIGTAYEAATASGSIIEVIPMPMIKGFEGMTFTAVADNLTLDAQDVGKVMYVTADAKTITLPATAAGLTYIIMNGSAATGTVAVTVSPNASDKIMGADLAGVDNKDRINTKATAQPGDYIKIVGDGSDGWYVLQEKGTWAAEA